MMESAEDRPLIRGGDITALDAILTAMFAELQGVDPLMCVICSQVFEDAAKSVEARANYINADKIDLLSALKKSKVSERSHWPNLAMFCRISGQLCQTRRALLRNFVGSDRLIPAFRWDML